MQAEVHSLESLDDLERSLATFSGKAADALKGMRAGFLRRLADLDRREEDARTDVENWAQALQLVEDEDACETYAHLLSQAQERLGRIRSSQVRAREDHSAFLAEAARFERLLDQSVPRCREFLRARAGELRAYGAVQPELSEGSAPNGSVSGGLPMAASEVARLHPTKVTEYRLPDGFVWVPLAEISEAALAGVGAKDDYKKVSYDTMATGLRRLAAEILPRISVNPDMVDRDYFGSLDMAAGESYENGLLRIYEAFFCQEFIYLVRPNGEEKFKVTNGRHRIRVALDLGWDAIPARIKDLKP